MKKALGSWTTGRAKGRLSYLSLRALSIEEPGNSWTCPQENHRYLMEDGLYQIKIDPLSVRTELCPYQ